MAQVTVSPEGEVLVVNLEGRLAFRSAEGIWSDKAPSGLSVEDVASWKLAKGEEEKALLIEAATVLGIDPITQMEQLESTPLMEFSPLANAISQYSERFGFMVPPQVVRFSNPDLLLKKLQQALRDGKPVEEWKGESPSMLNP